MSRLLPRTQRQAVVLVLVLLGAVAGRHALDRHEAHLAWAAWKDQGVREPAPPAVSGTHR